MLVLVELVVSVFIGCGSVVPKPIIGPDPPAIPNLYVEAYLAPEAPAEFPTTVRISLSIRNSLLPISGLAFDPDGEGQILPAEVEFEQFGKRGIYTEFYFDYLCAEPIGGWSNVTLTTSEGDLTFQAVRITDVSSLQVWPY